MNLNMEMVLLVIIAFIIGWFLSSNLIEGVIVRGEKGLDENGCPKSNPECLRERAPCSFRCAGESFLRGIKTLCERHKTISSFQPLKNICSQLQQ